MVSLCFVTILLLLFAVPAFPAQNSNYKIYIPDRLIYRFQSEQELLNADVSNESFHQRYNQDINDKIRVGTHRLWYSAGWDEQNAKIVGTKASSGPSSPAWGYLPTSKTAIDGQGVTDDLASFMGDFQANLVVGDEYWDKVRRPIPQYYFSSFRDEKSILDYYNDIVAVTRLSTLAGEPFNATLVWENLQSIGELTEDALIEIYHWFTERNITFETGELAGNLLGPTTDQLLELVRNVRYVLSYYSEKNWTPTGGLLGRLSEYDRSVFQAREFAYGTGSRDVHYDGWSSEMIKAAVELGIGTPQNAKSWHTRHGITMPSWLDVEYAIPKLVQKWFMSWHFYDRKDPYSDAVTSLANPPNTVRHAFRDVYGGTTTAGPVVPQRWGNEREFTQGVNRSGLPASSYGIPLGTWSGGEAEWIMEKVEEGKIRAIDFELWFGDIDYYGWWTNDNWAFSDPSLNRKRRADKLRSFGTMAQIRGRFNSWFAGSEWTNMWHWNTSVSMTQQTSQGIQQSGRDIQVAYHRALELAPIDPFSSAPTAAMSLDLEEYSIQQNFWQSIEAASPYETEFDHVIEYLQPLVDEEAAIYGRLSAVRDILDSGDIKLSNWKRSLVTIKPILRQHLTSLGYPESDLAPDFETLIRNEIEPALNERTIYYSDILRPWAEISTPRRYYDYVFQFPTVEGDVEVSPVYNGYFAQQFERTVSNLPLILEPIIPNLYIADFASMHVEEYYKILSLNAGTDAFPDGYMRGFNSDFPRGSVAYESLFEPLGYTSEYQYSALWANGVARGLLDVGEGLPSLGGLERLAFQYRDLVFSSMYKQNYLNTSNEALANASWVPMYNKVKFDFKEAAKGGIDDSDGFNSVFNHPEVRSNSAAPAPYDPLVNLAHDTQASHVSRKGCIEVTHVSPLPAEKFRTENAVQKANANMSPAESLGNLGARYESRRVWDIYRWFELYCITGADIFTADSWDKFYDIKDGFPEQSLMSAGPAVPEHTSTSPSNWWYLAHNHLPAKPGPNRSAGETSRPVPVGAKPRAFDMSQIIETCSTIETERITSQSMDEPARDSDGISKVEDLTTEIPSFTSPEDILYIPDPSGWRSPLGAARPLSGCDEDLSSNWVIQTALSNLYSKLSEKVEQYFRSIRQVLDGQLAYSEPIFYRLEKRDPSTDQVLQNFFFPADFLKGGFTYVDAQVHYGTEYNYTLYGYYFVVGNEYWYENLASSMALEHRHYIYKSGNATLAQMATYAGMSEAQFLLHILSNDPANEGQPRWPRSDYKENFAAELGLTYEQLLALQEEVVAAQSEVVTGEPSAGISQRYYGSGVGAFAPDLQGLYGGHYYKKPLTNHHAQFAVNNIPHLVLVETPVFAPDVVGAGTKMSTKIVDSPPLPPDVDMVPYRSVNNKILLLLNGAVGKYTDFPSMINQGDIDNYRSQIASQHAEVQPGTLADALKQGELTPEVAALYVTPETVEKNWPITFGADDYPEIFEIYRLDFPPTSYRDFASGRKKVLNNVVRNKVVMTANSFVDTIAPNTKYWYTFRVLDVHGNVSNPTKIFQMEMVDTGNSIYPSIEEYSFPESEFSYVKPMRRYLMIAPASKQERKSDNVVDAQSFVEFHELGTDVAGNDLWGKKYKLRVTSKSTGKKVDINFTFKQGEAPNPDKL